MLPRNYDTSDPMGLRRDVLAEGQMALSDLGHRLSEINVHLDAIAEYPEVLAEDELAEVRSLQRSVQSLYDEKTTDLEVTREEFNDVLAVIDEMD